MDLPPLRVPLDYKPMPKIVLPEPMPERRKWFGKTLLVILLVANIALGVLTFLFKDIFFQSAWAHSISVLSSRYNDDAEVFNKSFESINLKDKT